MVGILNIDPLVRYISWVLGTLGTTYSSSHSLLEDPKAAWHSSSRQQRHPTLYRASFSSWMMISLRCLWSEEEVGLVDSLSSAASAPFFLFFLEVVEVAPSSWRCSSWGSRRSWSTSRWAL